ncbi:SURF1 family protein [Flaviflexus massiliensis]|uniref:SURF1 family protein n=1 Tax=Flaviflexus massiliensis TaxID=1522309 RepID=UPI0006D57457|nr:SURF1 family protein [Flaviflexus massiliensis]
MGKYSFLTSPRWIGLIILMIIASITCVFLGQWQHGRYEEKVARANQIDTAWDQEAAPLGELDSRSDEWHETTVTGEFIPDSQLLLRGRSVSGQAAYQVIALMKTEVDGHDTTIIVDRGWITRLQADGDDGSEGNVPLPPAGTVTVEGRLRPPEEPNDRKPAPGYLYTLNPNQVIDALPNSVTNLAPVYEGRIELSSDQPGSHETGAPQAYPKPSTSLGSHLAYAWEWRFFALAALAVVPILARREAAENTWVVDGVDLRELDLTDEELRDLGLSTSRTEPKKKPSRRGRTDEEIEDEILDQASAINSR